jgi:hypothetical protein
MRWRYSGDLEMVRWLMVRWGLEIGDTVDMHWGYNGDAVEMH